MIRCGPHPRPDELQADRPEPAVALHLESCPECRVERRLLRAGPPTGAGAAPIGLLEEARRRAEQDETPGGDDAPPPPAEIGSGGPVYALGERIGAGSSAVVHRAYDPALRRFVALKVSTRSSPHARSRLLAEAQVTAQLDHPHIIPVYHMGLTEDGHPYVAEREVQGESLAQAITSGRLPTLASRVDALRKVCSAVAYAHSRGVLHRDLKPDNVMIGEYGEVQVIDWGLSRPIAAGSTEDSVHADRFESSADRTGEGRIAGTPAWMAPEQARGELDHLDARTDVYALGALLFYLTVGRPPVSEADPHAAIARVAAGPTLRPRDLDPNTPRELDAVAARAMAPELADRYPDVRSMLQDLDAWSQRRPLPHVGSRPIERFTKFATRNRTTLLSISALVPLALVAAAFGLWRYVADTREARDLADAEARRALDAERQAMLREADAQIALADAARLDGRERAALAALERATDELRRVDGDLRNAGWAMSALVAANPPPISTCRPSEGATLRAITVAPDGSAAVALDPAGAVVVWDPAGCAIQTRDELGAAPIDGSAAWLPDGPAVVAWVGAELIHLRPGLGVVARTALPPALLGGPNGPDRSEVAGLVLHPWGEGSIAAPDGTWWTFRFCEASLRTETPFDERPREISLVPGGEHLFAFVGEGHIERRGLYHRPTLTLLEPYWISGSTTRDGRRTLANTRDGVQALDLEARTPLWSIPETPYGEVGIAPGDRVAWHAMAGIIHTYDLATGKVIGRVVAPRSDRLVAVSRDARLLLTAGPEGAVSSWLQADRPLARLAEEVPAERGPRLALSPDGRTLAVAGLRGSSEVEVLDLATGVTLRRLPAGDLVDDLTWSPDGHALVASTIEAGIVAWEVVTGRERWRRPLPSGERPMAWVEDELVYVEDDGSVVVLGGADGSERRRWPVLTGSSVDIEAVPGSRRVVIGSYLPQAPSAVLLDLDRGEVIHRLDEAENRAQIRVSPDGTLAILAGWTGRTVVWDLRSGQIAQELHAESGPTIGAAFSPDGTVVVTSSWDEEVVFWDRRSGERLRTVALGRQGGFLQFTPGGSTLLVVSWSWKVEELFLDAHRRHREAVQALQGSPEQRAEAFATLGWWERVIPELDRGTDDPLLRARAELASGRADRAAQAAGGLPSSAYRAMLTEPLLASDP